MRSSGRVWNRDEDMGGSDWSGASGRGGMSYRPSLGKSSRERCGLGFTGNDFAETKPSAASAASAASTASASTADAPLFPGDLLDRPAVYPEPDAAADDDGDDE